MVESGDDSIVFNKNDIPKIMTITKERSSIDQNKEKFILINKEKNKININLDNKDKKLNNEELMKSLKKIQKLKTENFNEDFYDNHNNNNKIKISPYNYDKKSNNKYKKFIKKEKEDNCLNLNKNKLDILDHNCNHMRINIMKNNILKKEKEEQQNNKFNSTELLENNIFDRISNNNDFIKGSERDVLKIKISNNSDIEDNNNKFELNYNRKKNYIYMKNDTKIKEKKNRFNINTKELTRNNTLNLNRKNSTNLITSIVNMINSTKTYISDNTQNSPHDKCLICERNFSVVNLCCSECNMHFFCRKCLKNYCRELIEKGVKRMKCPITKCNYNIYEEFLKSILSDDYYQLLFKRSKTFKSEEITIAEESSRNNKYDIFNKRIKQNSEDKIQNIRLYSNKHVFDINSNMMLYNVKKYKDEYCKKCNEPTLFCKADTIFYKCLNCGFKICKYCNNEYTVNHLAINNPNHCKVYYRKKEEETIKNNYCFNYVIQIIYTIAMFYITFAYTYLIIYRFFNAIFKINKKWNNIFLIIIIRIKYIIFVLISFIIFMILFPFLFIWTPFFPIIIALIDGF